MSVKILFEGHYRALERDFQRLMLDLLKKGAAPLVIASGTHQLRRLRDLLHSASGTKVIGGVVFLPGIRHLAQRFQEVPAPLLAVSHADRTMLALEAMKGLDQDQPLYDLRNNVETAHSLGSFLEDLLERGISPEAYDIASLSLQRERTLTEKTVGEVFGRYARQREERYFSTGDIIMEGNTHAPAGGPMVFYGFYDLSPLQRRFLRRILSRSGDFYWFSPLAVSSQWGDIYARTRNLLDGVGVGSVSRSGERIPMNSFADLFESLPGRSRPLVPSSGFRVTAAAGEFGACREVLERITELNGKEGVPFERIAVVRRKEGGGSLARMAHHEGIPVNEPLKAAMAEIPQGLFVTELLNCMNQDFYHLHLENMFSLGLLRQEYSAHPSEVIRVASRMGIRMGMGKWRDWYSSREEVCGMAEFLRKLDSFAGSLPGRCSPAGYLRRLKEFCEEVLIDPAEPSIRDALFDFRCFRSNSEIGLEQFSRILRIHFQETVVILREGNPHGFRVLNPEKLRGTLQDSVFVMDMEEGIYPRPQVEDPRLSEELRKALQLSLKQQRELEDGFLLRQVGEAASRTFDIIYRQQDESGVEIAPSFLISELIEREIHRKVGSSWFSTASSSPVRQLLGGLHPGQERVRGILEGDLPQDPGFLGALRAECSRMRMDSFDEYDGIIGRPPFEIGAVSPTLLESYVSCPFRFLASWRSAWGLERECVADVGSSPDPRIRGKIVHEAAEKIIRGHGFEPERETVSDILEEAAAARDLTGKLGAHYLSRLFVLEQTDAVLESLKALSGRGWDFLGSELDLSGELGGIPISGRIDLVLTDSDSRLVLVDLKTGSLPGRRDVTRGRYYQLPFYYILATQNFRDREIRMAAYASVSKATPGKLLEFSGSDIEGDLPRVMKYTEELVGMIRSGLFPPVASDSCRHCDLSGLCRNTPFRRIREKLASDDRMELLRRIHGK